MGIRRTRTWIARRVVTTRSLPANISPIIVAAVWLEMGRWRSVRSWLPPLESRHQRAVRRWLICRGKRW